MSRRRGGRRIPLHTMLAVGCRCSHSPLLVSIERIHMQMHPLRRGELLDVALLKSPLRKRELTLGLWLRLWLRLEPRLRLCLWLKLRVCTMLHWVKGSLCPYAHPHAEPAHLVMSVIGSPRVEACLANVTVRCRLGHCLGWMHRSDWIHELRSIRWIRSDVLRRRPMLWCRRRAAHNGMSWGTFGS